MISIYNPHIRVAVLPVNSGRSRLISQNNDGIQSDQMFLESVTRPFVNGN